ncbi:lon protease homolog 2, peroxisomal-like isoform X1 [Olea europaea subsp. europaea]|uniref:Lon protease homolog 2, peroxisomal-like isoform X1 n=1 Tax=Olea europaea subsp. europaea TaxID=158383 RepID=A0A8S0SDU0_OLEEU|nr:lon protease homolog 2, peroxisomal-like isoform X1 [Olea europaea subsp. europaea]
MKDLNSRRLATVTPLSTVTQSGRPVSEGYGETPFFWLLLLLPTVESPSSLFDARLRRLQVHRPPTKSTEIPFPLALHSVAPLRHYTGTRALAGAWRCNLYVGNDLGAYNSSRVYLDLLADLPWQKASEEHELDLKAAKDHLDSDHYGLVKIKHRIIEYLAVRKIHDEAKKFSYQTGVKVVVAYGGAPIFQ